MIKVINKQDINSSLKTLKGLTFCYLLFEKENVVYVGNSKNIYKRLKEHKYKKEFNSVQLFECKNEFVSKKIERQLIYELTPKYNVYCINKYREPDTNKYSINGSIQKANIILNRKNTVENARD
jgi:excinuclease UvrABC nuclease subunit